MDKKNISYTLPEIAKRFENHIRKNNYDFQDDRVKSVFDYLLISYMESRGRDPKPIEQGFADLENYMEGISLEDNNAIFCLVCNLCNFYEERAFKDGLQLGAYLMLEFQEK